MIIKLSFPEYGCITGCDLHNSLIININRGAGGTGNHANHPTTKGCVQPTDEECQRRTAGRSTDKFLGGVR